MIEYYEDTKILESFPTQVRGVAAMRTKVSSCCYVASGKKALDRRINVPSPTDPHMTIKYELQRSTLNN